MHTVAYRCMQWHTVARDVLCYEHVHNGGLKHANPPTHPTPWTVERAQAQHSCCHACTLLNHSPYSSPAHPLFLHSSQAAGEVVPCWLWRANDDIIMPNSVMTSHMPWAWSTLSTRIQKLSIFKVKVFYFPDRAEWKNSASFWFMMFLIVFPFEEREVFLSSTVFFYYDVFLLCLDEFAVQGSLQTLFSFCNTDLWFTNYNSALNSKYLWAELYNDEPPYLIGFAKTLF